MNINLSNSIIFNIIVLFLLCSSVKSSTSCSIFPSLNCSCFQSNLDLTSTLPIKTYSHLYCQGTSLDQNTFQSPFGLDFKHQNRFRTVSIQFFLKQKVEIITNQFDALAMLFSLTESSAQIEVTLHFNGFQRIKFHPQAITSNIFQRKHQNTRLKLHFIPETNSNQLFTGEDNSMNNNEQFQFSQNPFGGLTVSQLKMHIHTLHNRFSSSSSFEDVFNNTNIGELHFDGSIIPPDQSQPSKSFKGFVRSLTLHRHVDTIDATEFPHYSHVLSYNIHSIEAHSIDLQSFIPLYNNLRGLDLTKPRFEVSIDKIIPTLDSLSLDIEYFNERTLLAARHIHYLKFGPSLRRIHPQVLRSLPIRLRLFDLADINLSEMTTDSLCSLIEFLYRNSQRLLNIIFPRTETLTECNCARLILDDIQSNHIHKNHPAQESTCSKQCRFSVCPIISEHFREKYPLIINNQRGIGNLHDDLPSVDLFSDPSDMALMSFLVNQSNNEQTDRSESQFASSASQINSQHSDDVPFSHITHGSKNKQNKSKTTDYFSWMTLLTGIMIVLFIVIIIMSIVFFVRRHRKQNQFIAVPVYM
ncbi:unnamed protein product [Adineta ricciae]|uniref:Uncharacterized protein n=1 Tax=Adineta ricciae TaxID=249248 RepID=A0A813VF76_ADIRI|nr:unnamed protein product [Adineta ricciae]CAF1116915.1 unnamed protein product [Adineta ricciae]